jgi:hypothetical protein
MLRILAALALLAAPASAGTFSSPALRATTNGGEGIRCAWTNHGGKPLPVTTFYVLPDGQTTDAAEGLMNPGQTLVGDLYSIGGQDLSIAIRCGIDAKTSASKLSASICVVDSVGATNGCTSGVVKSVVGPPAK